MNTNHPVIHEARKNGNTLFVIATLYQAEHCNIEVSFSEKEDESASAAASSAPLLGTTAGGSLDESQSSIKGVLT